MLWYSNIEIASHLADEAALASVSPPCAWHRHAWHPPRARDLIEVYIGTSPDRRARVQRPSSAAESCLDPGPQLVSEGLCGKGPGELAYKHLVFCMPLAGAQQTRDISLFKRRRKLPLRAQHCIPLQPRHPHARDTVVMHMSMKLGPLPHVSRIEF